MVILLLYLIELLRQKFTLKVGLKSSYLGKMAEQNNNVDPGVANAAAYGGLNQGVPPN
jgi:hypothetical protein